MKPHPKTTARWVTLLLSCWHPLGGHPCFSLLIAAGRDPPLLINHLLSTMPAPLVHVSQPWGLSMDGGGFRGRMLNCIAQLSDLQSFLLAPTLPFPSLTTAGNVDGSAPPTHLLHFPLESKRLLEGLNLARLGLRPPAGG